MNIQIHIVNDFEYAKDSSDVSKNNTLCTVIFCALLTAIGPVLVCLCQFCDSKGFDKFPIYLTNDWKEFGTDLPPLNLLFQCRHRIAVGSYLIAQNGIKKKMDSKSINLDADIVFFLSNALYHSENALVLDSWYHPNTLDISYRFGKTNDSHGKLCIFITDSFEVLRLVIFISEKTKYPKIHCLECPRSKSCRHARKVHPTILLNHPYVKQNVNLDNIQNDLDPASENEIEMDKKITLSRHGAPLLSKLKYPDDIRDDPEVCKHISCRQISGTSNWSNNNLKRLHFIITLTLCVSI